MKKLILPLFIVASLLLLLILFVMYNRYSGYYQEEQTLRYISRNIDILNENFEFEKRYALSLSLYVSKNKVIQEALVRHDQKAALAEIHTFLEEIEVATGIRNIDVQIHTKDLRAFARNWDNGDYLGAQLGGFRKGLVQVKRTKLPLVSIELGKRLNIKAISPILDEEKKFVGSIEIIMGFGNIKQRLKKFGLAILGLLEEQFISIAVDLKNHDRVAGYYVVERAYPRAPYRLLHAHSEILKQNKSYHKIGQNLVVLVPMKSVGIQDVGVIVMVMDAEEPKNNNYVYQTINAMESTHHTLDYPKREVHIK